MDIDARQFAEQLVKVGDVDHRIYLAALLCFRTGDESGNPDPGLIRGRLRPAAIERALNHGPVTSVVVNEDDVGVVVSRIVDQLAIGALSGKPGSDQKTR